MELKIVSWSNIPLLQQLSSVMQAADGGLVSEVIKNCVGSNCLNQLVMDH